MKKSSISVQRSWIQTAAACSGSEHFTFIVHTCVRALLDCIVLMLLLQLALASVLANVLLTSTL